MGRPQDVPHCAFKRPSRRQACVRILLRPTVSRPSFHTGAPVRDAYEFLLRAAYDPRLCELSNKLITSFVYSHDLVSRLSLGSLRDMSRAAVWLCKAEAEGRPEGYSGITRRALRHKMGFGSRDDPVWVCLSPSFLPVMVLINIHLGAVPVYPQDA
jgi:hypothetical protein